MIDQEILDRLAANDNTLVKLMLKYINSNDIHVLMKTLTSSKNMCLRNLNLIYNHIGDEDAKALAQGNFHTLNLYGNQIGYEGAKALAQCNFHTLNLGWNHI